MDELYSASVWWGGAGEEGRVGVGPVEDHKAERVLSFMPVWKDKGRSWSAMCTCMDAQA